MHYMTYCNNKLVYCCVSGAQVQRIGQGVFVRLLSGEEMAARRCA
jgi:hypothetical protein